MADIFDKILNGINRGVNSVAVGSKNMVEKAKINSAISELESEKSRMAEEIGARVYNLYKEGRLRDIDLLVPLCEELDSKIKEIQARMRELEMYDAPEQPYQPYPPSGEVSQQEVFTLKKTETADAEFIFCPDCGTRSGVGAKFCGCCGKPLI